jgi:hypothetical protein
MSTRSAGPLISKLRKNVLARKRASISSSGSYDSCAVSMVNSVTSAGSAGSCMAGPRVRVRRGRSAKLPECHMSTQRVVHMRLEAEVSYQSVAGSAPRGRQSGRPGGVISLLFCVDGAYKLQKSSKLIYVQASCVYATQLVQSCMWTSGGRRRCRCSSAWSEVLS